MAREGSRIQRLWLATLMLFSALRRAAEISLCCSPLLAPADALSKTDSSRFCCRLDSSGVSATKSGMALNA